jgi:SAM-dependent methyltransferase
MAQLEVPVQPTSHGLIRSLAVVTSNCPLCTGEGVLVTDVFEGYIEGWRTQLATCEDCELTFSTNRDVPANLYEHIYSQARRIPGYSRYVGYANEIKQQEDPASWLAANEDPYRLPIAWLEKHPATGPVLEFGSGLGYLTYALRRRGLDAVGVDLSQSAVDSARARFDDPEGYHLPAGIHARRPDGFDLVVGLEIVEHVPDPISFVREGMAYLRPGGTLLLSTPNRDAFTAETLWESDTPPVHLTWFGSRSMKVIADAVGATMEIIDLSTTDSAALPRSGTNEVLAAFLTANGAPTRTAKIWTNRSLGRAGTLLGKVPDPLRVGRRRLPGVARPALEPVTSHTLGVALTRQD